MMELVLFISNCEIKAFQVRRKLGKLYVEEKLSLDIRKLSPEEVERELNNIRPDDKHPTRIILGDINLFARVIRLPFSDLHKARLAAPSVISGSLPFENDYYFDLVYSGEEENSHTFTALITPKQEVEHRLSLIPWKEGVEHLLPAALLAVCVTPFDEKSLPRRRIYLDERILGVLTDHGDRITVKFFSPSRLKNQDQGEFANPGLAIEGDTTANLPESLPYVKTIDSTMVETFLKHGLLNSVNFFSLETEQKKDIRAQKWKRTTIVLSGILIFLSVITLVEGTRISYKRKAEILKKEVNKIFSSVMGEIPIVDPVSQIEEKIKTIENEVKLLPGDGTTLTEMLVGLSRSFGPGDGIIITSFKYTRGRGSFQGISGNQKKINDLITRLEEMGFKAELIDSGPAAESGKIKFSVKMEKK